MVTIFREGEHLPWPNEVYTVKTLGDGITQQKSSNSKFLANFLVMNQKNYKKDK